MLHFIKKTALKGVNGAFNLVGHEVRRKTHNWEDVKQFIPFQETQARARAANLPIGEYIDAIHNVPGATQDTHDRLVALGVFKDRIDRVCEIGPGSGRYLEKTLRACNPSHYEIYETAEEWAGWLVNTYKVKSLPVDGKSLAQTPTASIDLIQAHRVFVVTLFLTTCNYFHEISRVAKPGAWVIFDIMSEDCMDTTDLTPWLKTGINSRTYPAIMPKRFVIGFFENHGFEFVSSFVAPMKPGKTEVMVFRKHRT